MQKEQIQEIIERNFNDYLCTNEAIVHASEEIVSFFKEARNIEKMLILQEAIRGINQVWDNCRRDEIMDRGSIFMEINEYLNKEIETHDSL